MTNNKMMFLFFYGILLLPTSLICPSLFQVGIIQSLAEYIDHFNGSIAGQLQTDEVVTTIGFGNDRNNLNNLLQRFISFDSILIGGTKDNFTMQCKFYPSNLNKREQGLITHAIRSFQMIKNTKIESEILEIEGMTSHNIRYLLNNLCSLDNSRYLEIGVYKGATFISALYGNINTQAVAVDNWSEFFGPKDIFEKNCKLLHNINYTFYESDCFTLNPLQLFDQPVDIYFYDGWHSAESQEKAFTYYNSILADSFVAIIDDWNHPPVRLGTKRAFEKLGYTVLLECILDGNRPNREVDSWWNGFYVAVIRK